MEYNDRETRRRSNSEEGKKLRDYIDEIDSIVLELEEMRLGSPAKWNGCDENQLTGYHIELAIARDIAFKYLYGIDFTDKEQEEFNRILRVCVNDL